MGTIAEKLSYLADTKDLFKDRLNSLGAEITSSTTFRNYLNWLDTFYGEVSDKTDLSQNGVVGRTNQETTTGKNLIPFTNQDFTLKGIRFYAQRGSLYLDGTSVGEIGTTSQEFKDNFNFILSAGTYDFSLSNQIGATSLRKYDDNTVLATINGDTIQSVTFTLNEDTKVYVGIYLYQQTFNNVKTTYQVETGSSATSYEPYTYGASPNPSYPQPVNNLTGNVDYTICGKNLLNKANGTYESWVSIDITDLIEDGANYYVSIDYKNLIGSCAIRIDYTYNGTINYIWGDGGSTGDVTEGTMYKQFNIPNHDVNTTIYLRVKDNGTGLTSGYYSNWLLAKSDIVTNYEPYIEPQTFTIPLGDIELCGIDTYEDKIYSSNGRFYLRKETRKVVLNGSEHWTQAQQGFFADANMFPNRDLLAYKGYCNYFIVNDTSTTWTNLYYCGWNAIGLFWIRDDYTLASTQTEFKQWVSAHNLQVYYVLETPTTTEITQENYPSLYNALKQIQDYLTAYKINKEFILGYSSPEIEY